MKLRLIILIGLLLCLLQNATGKEPDWLQKMNSITLFSSTRQDAIRVFGQTAGDQENYSDYFDISEGRVFVLYSNGNCFRKNEDGVERVYGWLVPKWTITSMSIDFKKPINFKNLKVDLSKFRSYKENDNPTIHYYNRDLGIDYSFWMGKFTGMTLEPPNKFDNLLCK